MEGMKPLSLVVDIPGVEDVFPTQELASIFGREFVRMVNEVRGRNCGVYDTVKLREANWTWETSVKNVQETVQSNASTVGAQEGRNAMSVEEQEMENPTTGQETALIRKVALIIGTDTSTVWKGIYNGDIRITYNIYDEDEESTHLQIELGRKWGK